MKDSTLNTFIVLLFLLTSLVAFSQENEQNFSNESYSLKTESHNYKQSTRSLIFSEDFSGEVGLPEGWSVVGSGQGDWAVVTSNLASGVAPEVALKSMFGFTGNSKLVSPKIHTSGYDEVILQFNHFLHNYTGNGGSTLLVETTSDGVTWHTVWSKNITASINPQTVFIAINNQDVGSDDFQLAITFNGNTLQIVTWNIDNIMLNESLAHDAEATNIFVPSIAGTVGNISPIGVVSNKGTETVSFDATVEILDDELNVVYTQTIPVTNLLSFESKVLNFTAWAPVLGNYTVNLTTSLVGDENVENDLFSSSISIQENVLFKKPLYEEFTSSTCGPCGLQNPVLDAILAANPITHSVIKYQVNFPGSGDPYYISECGVRSSYYGNEEAPKLFINSNPSAKPISFIKQSDYDLFIGLPAKIDIDIVSASIDQDMNVTIEVNINVIEDFAAGLKAQIAVVEKTTYDNARTNGETEFNNVLMKMLPNASGTTLGALSVGNTISISESYNMNLTFMEEHTDLAVVVFVQDNTDKKVLQSEMMDISILTGIENSHLSKHSLNLFPNPASGNINVDSESKIEHLIIFNLMGQIVFESKPRANSMNIDISNLESGMYLFKVIGAEGIIVKQVVVK